MNACEWENGNHSVNCFEWTQRLESCLVHLPFTISIPKASENSPKVENTAALLSSDEEESHSKHCRNSDHTSNNNIVCLVSQHMGREP